MNIIQTCCRNVAVLFVGALLVSCGGGGGDGGGDGGGGGRIGAAPDTTPPTVSSVSPANSATGVAVNAAITATFSETMTTSPNSTATFTLNNGVTGVVTNSGTTATFTPTPASSLAYAKAYIATITTGAKDAAGNALASDYTWTFTTRVAPINDTGITSSQCYQTGSSDLLVACNATGATGLNVAQDGMVGRDVTVADPTPSDGKLGFSFTKVCNNGQLGGSTSCSPSAVLASTPLDWGCTQDNVTGLMWEVKTTSGLRNWSTTYTNYDSATANQKGTGTPPTQTEIDLATNSIGFINAVNATNLCGYSDWRMPTTDELLSIVDYGVASSGPTVDANWFPNTQSNVFWASSPYVASPVLAWYVSLLNGYVDFGSRTVSYYVRLVRAGQ